MRKISYDTVETTTGIIKKVLGNTAYSLGTMSGMHQAIEIVGINKVDEDRMLEMLRSVEFRLENANKLLLQTLLELEGDN